MAQYPSEKRDQSRLMIIDRQAETSIHDYFFNLGRYLSARDLIVVNNTKVFPARLTGQKETGGKIELLLLRPIQDMLWEVLLKPAKGISKGVRIIFEDQEFTGLVEKNLGGGKASIRFDYRNDFMEVIEKLGSVPLPPYIKRNDHNKIFHNSDKERYQTVYATIPGAVAAPTAGLHFSPEVMRTLRENGTDIIEITLHVGPGTFRPLTSERIEDHVMEDEWFSLGAEAAQAINLARSHGKGIVAVGTTTTRALETVSALFPGEIKPYSGSTGLFIYPGYKFSLVDKLITNFHMPRSTPLLLASAFTGQCLLAAAYQEAIRAGYRFFSFGDATLIV